MAGFRSLAREVRNPRMLPAQRRTYLRRCLERFAPYGHRATWHHLCARAGIAPEDRAPDPVRLVCALDELEEARSVWLAYEAEFADRRRREKHDGVRQPTALDDWHRRTWGGRNIARCADPIVHPSDHLADVLRRMIAALQAGPGEACPVCTEVHLVWRRHLGLLPAPGPVCTGCGIVVPIPALAPETIRRAGAGRRPAVTGGQSAVSGARTDAEPATLQRR